MSGRAGAASPGTPPEASSEGLDLSARAAWLIAGALLVVHVALGWAGREIGLLTAQDDGRYMILARALAEGTYRDLYLIGTPLHAVYPPVYPAVLAAWGAVAGSDFGRLLLPSLLFSAGALGFVFAATRRLWSPVAALTCLACLAVNPWLVARAGSVRSEPLYMLLSMIALWGVVRAHPSARWIVVASGAAILAALTRTIGVTLVGALGLYWLYRRQWKPLVAFGVASGAAVGGWLLFTALAPNQLEGIHYFADMMPEGGDGLLATLLDRLGRQVPGYAVKTVEAFAPPGIRGTPVDNLLWAIIIATGLSVGLFQLMRRWAPAALYLVLYGVVVLVWPYEHIRFIEPIIPLLFVAVFLGLDVTVGRFRPRWRRVALSVFAGFVLAGSVWGTRGYLATRQDCGPFSLGDPPACLQPDRASYLRALDWVVRETDPDEVFLTLKPEPLYLYTGRRSVLFPVTPRHTPDRYVEGLVSLGIDRIIQPPRRRGTGTGGAAGGRV